MILKILAALVLKQHPDDLNCQKYKVVVAYQVKSGKTWHSKEMICDGFPPDYFFETVAKNGRPNNTAEVAIYFNQNLNQQHYEKPV